MARETSNALMCEVVTLRGKNRESNERIKLLEKYLRRAHNDLTTMSAQYDDNESKHLIDKIGSILDET